MTTYISTGKQEQVKYKQKMDTLHDFFRAKDIPFELRKNVRLFYDNLLRKKTIFDEQEILASLPPALANDVIYTLYSDTIVNTSMFVGLEDEVVAKLCMKLTPFHVVAGTVVSREGHQGGEVYIIQAGEILISRGGVHLAVIGPGSSFGEMSALGFSLGPKGNHRDKTATAVTDCDTVFVTGEVLYDLMDDYDSLRVSLRKVVERRIKVRKKAKAKKNDRMAEARKAAHLNETPSDGVASEVSLESLETLDRWKSPEKTDRELGGIGNRPRSESNAKIDKKFGQVCTESKDAFAAGLVGTEDTNDASSLRSDLLRDELAEVEAKAKSGATSRVKPTAALDGSTAEVLQHIDQTLSTLVLQQSVLARRVAEVERTMKRNGSHAANGGGAALKSPKFNPVDLRELISRPRGTTSVALESVSGGGRMVLTDGLEGGVSSSSDDEDGADSVEGSFRTRSHTDMLMEGDGTELSAASPSTTNEPPPKATS
jgi:CRP-like cAMP-binding protein